MMNLFQPARCGIAFLLVVWLAGCQTSQRRPPELTTTALDEEMKIVAPAPLKPVPLIQDIVPAKPPPRITDDWPEQWAGGWIPLANLCRFAGAKLSVLARAGANPGYRIESSSGRLELRSGSRMASWEGVQFWLAHGPQVFEEKPYVQALDARKNLLPLLRPARLALAGRRVALDPGHGGRDFGTQSILGTDREKDLVLDWAFRLKSLLEARGWHVILTRTNDLELSLTDRVQLAETAQADLFISLHFNSAFPSADRTGIETYCLTPTGLPSTLVRFDQDDPDRTFPNNAYDEPNFLLALRVQRALVRHTGAVDRGVRRARFMTVLRGQNRPAILVEGGFLSADSEARKLASAAYRQLLAECVAVGLDGPSAALPQPTWLESSNHAGRMRLPNPGEPR